MKHATPMGGSRFGLNPHRESFRHIYRRLRDEWQGRGTAAGAFDSLAATNERLFAAAINARCLRRERQWGRSIGREAVRLKLEAARCRRMTGWAESEWQRKVGLH